MIRHKLFIAFLALCISCSFAKASNELDSLLKATKAYSLGDSVAMMKTGKKTIDLAKKQGRPVYEMLTLLYYGNYHYFTAIYDKADEYYRTVHKMALEHSNDSIRHMAECRHAFIQSDTGNVAQAIAGFERVYAEARVIGNTIGLIESLNGLAGIKSQKGKIDEAIALYHEAIRIARDDRRTYQYSYLLNNVGLLKAENERWDEALRDYQEALKMAKQQGQTALFFHLNNNIGMIYVEKMQLDSGLHYYKISNHLVRQSGHPDELCVSYINLASVNVLKEDFDAAYAYYDSATVLIDQYKFPQYRPKLLLGQANAKNKQKKYSEAITLADEALEGAVSADYLEAIKGSYSILHKAYAGLGKYEKAYEYHKLYKEYGDSLGDLAMQKQFSELQVRFDVEEKDRALSEERSKVEILEKDRELSEARDRLFYILGVALVLFFILIAVLVYLNYSARLRRQQEQFSQKLIVNIEEERSRIARDLHDDIGPRLSMIKNKLFANDEGSHPELDKDFGEIMDHIRSISHQLYPAYISRVGLSVALEELLEMVESDTGLTCIIEADEVDKMFGPEEKTHLFRIVQECISNTLKHAKATSIKLTMHKSLRGMSMSYQDNGIGMQKKEGGLGMGLMSIAERVKLMGGTMSMGKMPGIGLKFSFEFNKMGS